MEQENKRAIMDGLQEAMIIILLIIPAQLVFQYLYLPRFDLDIPTAFFMVGLVGYAILIQRIAKNLTRPKNVRG